MAPTWSCSFFLNTLLLTLILIHTSVLSCREDDRSALLAFKLQFLSSSELCYWGPTYSYRRSSVEILGFFLTSDAPPPCSVDYDQKQQLESWTEESNCCEEWEGVECDNNGHVIGLDLSNIPCLCASSIDPALSRLVHLQKLNLANVNFNITTIPSSILANLTQLRLLNLSSCYLEGRIPFLNLTNLSTLDLSDNYDLSLTGAAFLDLSRSLRKLEYLDLDLVDISAPVPDALANLSSLTTLVISNCHLQGRFPTAIFALPKLENLRISDNPNLSGQLPTTFNVSTTSLDVLMLSFTNFSGEISNDLVENLLRFLTVFRISDCNFHGELPSSLSNLTKLSMLYVVENGFFGPVPSFVNCAQLSRLRMGGNMLTGNTPPSLGNLTHLSILELSSNQLTGPIPDSLKEGLGLTRLNLANNMLTGRIPSVLGNLTHLEVLDLNSNGFDGPVPSTISQLIDLNVLFLHRNFLNGTLRFDQVFSQQLQQNLQYLDLSFNSLSLVFDPPPHQNNKFVSLGLASCDLKEFPPFLRGQDHLQWLDLSSNHIYGKVPQWFMSMNSKYLFHLNISINSLVGFSKDPVHSNWTSIETLDLRSNDLQGSLPIPPSEIEYYLVSNNRLSGEVPPSVCSLSDIRVLDLAKNNFTGAVPQCLSNLTDTLRILSLHDNNFCGTIPDHGGGSSCALRMIDASNNRLQGHIPRWLSNCTELRFLNLGKNGMVDTFPSWLGSLGKLRVLILRSNWFHGAIGEPQNDTEFSNLQIIVLSQNIFGGSLPSKYFNCWNITKRLSLDQSAHYLGESKEQEPHFYAVNSISNEGYDYSMRIINKGIDMEYAKIPDYFTAIDLSSNNFSGEIPNSIGSLEGLHLLNLSNNILTGQIPRILKDLMQLESLDLSSNKFSGQIPQELTQLTFLEFLDVSSNQLSGPIPRGPQFNTFDNRSYEDNPRLCGFPLTKECGNPEPPSQYHHEENSESDNLVEWEVTAIGFVGGLVVGAVMGLVVPITRYQWLVRIIVPPYNWGSLACW